MAECVTKPARVSQCVCATNLEIAHSESELDRYSQKGVWWGTDIAQVVSGKGGGNKGVDVNMTYL